ncbi:MAG: hypothetical protein RDA78_21150 [Roseibium sp.]|uniref:hypothetical protein n=1 Tax=Roseibium sp. TaxID=1936156 RepID=UPI003D9C3D93
MRLAAEGKYPTYSVIFATDHFIVFCLIEFDMNDDGCIDSVTVLFDDVDNIHNSEAGIAEIGPSVNLKLFRQQHYTVTDPRAHIQLTSEYGFIGVRSEFVHHERCSL